MPYIMPLLFRVLQITLILMAQRPGTLMELPSVETRNSLYMQMLGICGGITEDDYEIVISQHCVSGQDDYFMILSHEVTHWYQYTYMGAGGWEEDRPEEEAQIISRLICSQIRANICGRTVWRRR